jgi:polyisoprenoid-binding protein YceI
MRQGKKCRAAAWAVAAMCLTALPVDTAAQARPRIDPAKSTVTVRVDRAGLFSVFGDNHLVSGPIADGWISLEAPLGVELRIESAALRVLDPWLSASDRAEVQERMLGPDVLDVERYPAISFVSTSVVADGPDRWKATGQLSLHGMTREIAFPVARRNGRYLGSVRIKQRDFGIRPVTVALGTIRVKDEIVIEFDVALVERTEGRQRPASGMLFGG